MADKRKATLESRREAQQKRNDPQITHTIADLAAIQHVLDARAKALKRAHREAGSGADDADTSDMI